MDQTQQMNFQVLEDELPIKDIGKTHQDVLNMENKIIEVQLNNTHQLIFNSLVKYLSTDRSTGVTLKQILDDKKGVTEKWIEQKDMVKYYEQKKQQELLKLPYPPPQNLKVYKLDHNKWSKFIDTYNDSKMLVRNSFLVPKSETSLTTINKEAFITHKINVDNIEDTTGETVQKTVFIPKLDSYWKGNEKGGNIPKYFPHYTKVPYDDTLLGYFRACIQTMWTYSLDTDYNFNYIDEVKTTVQEQQYCEDYYRQLCVEAEGSFFGNGSVFGQMGRWLACKKVNEYAKQYYKHDYISDVEYFNFLSKYVLCLNTNPIIKIDGSNTMDYLQISDSLQLKGYKGLEINKDAGDGLLFEGSKKGETILSDILLSRIILSDLTGNTTSDLIAFMAINKKVVNDQEGLIKMVKERWDIDRKLEIAIKSYLKRENPDENTLSNYDILGVIGRKPQQYIINEKEDKNIVLMSKVSVQTFWKKWAFLRVAKMKPKSEVYEVGLDDPNSEGGINLKGMDTTNKTRNYWESNLSIHLPFIVLTNWMLDNKPKITNFDCHSLSGWAPVSGGIHLLIKRILSKRSKMKKESGGIKPGTIIDWFIFSDNVFFAVEQNNDDWAWISLDGSKMEASSTPLFGQKLSRMYNMIFKGMISPTLVNYLKIVTPAALTTMVGCLGMKLIYMDFLSSGSVGTSICNHFKMAEVMVYLNDFILNGEAPFKDIMAQKLNFTDHFKERLQQSGVILKIERVQKDMVKTMLKGEYLDLDLLGYGAKPVKFEVPGITLKDALSKFCIVPYLSKERLRKMLCFLKIEGSKSGTELDSARSAIVRMIKLKLAYIYGLFTEPGISNMIAVTHTHIMSQINNRSLDSDFKIDNESWLEWMSEAEELFGYKTLMNTLNEMNMPSTATIIRLTMGEEIFLDFMNQINGKLLKTLGKKYISPNDLIMYVGGEQYKKLYAKENDNEKLNVYFTEKNIEINLKDFYKQLEDLQKKFLFEFKDTFSSKIYEVVDLTTVPVLSAAKSGSKPSIDQYKTLVQNLLNLFIKSNKLILDTMGFDVKFPLPNIFSFMYSIMCTSIRRTAGIPLAVVMAIVKDFPLTCFSAGHLRVLLKRVQEIGKGFYSDLNLKFGLTIHDPTLNKYPEFLYIYLLYLTKFFVPKELSKNKVKKTIDSNTVTPYGQYIADRVYHYWPLRLDKFPLDNFMNELLSTGEKESVLLKYLKSHIFGVMSDMKISFELKLDEEPTIKTKETSSSSNWGDEEEEIKEKIDVKPVKKTEWDIYYENTTNFFISYRYMYISHLVDKKDTEILYNRDWDDYSQFLLGLREDRAKFPDCLRCAKFSNVKNYISASINQAEFDNTMHSLDTTILTITSEDFKVKKLKNIVNLEEQFL